MTFWEKNDKKRTQRTERHDSLYERNQKGRNPTISSYKLFTRGIVRRGVTCMRVVTRWSVTRQGETWWDVT